MKYESTKAINTVQVDVVCNFRDSVLIVLG